MKDGRVKLLDLEDSGDPVALARPDLIAECAERFGSQCVVLAIDARRRAGDGGFDVVVDGGRTPVAGREAVGWAREGCLCGAGEILLTSMDRDGTRQGFDLELTRAVGRAVPVPVIASGGAKGPESFHDVLTAGEADAALSASIFHKRKATVASLKTYLAARGVPVRPVA